MIAEEITPKKRSKREIFHRFVDRNRLNVGISLSFFLQVFVAVFWYVPKLEFNNLDKFVEEVAFVDSVSITENAPDTPNDGDLELADKLKNEEKVDPRVAGAQDSVLAGGTEPIDLNPSEKALYTEEARANGVEGTITIEVVIANTGEVLQVKSVGRNLGFGLVESAIRTYKKKKFSPSLVGGVPTTVKVLIPVRFVLN
jgi:TonB family protein